MDAQRTSFVLTIAALFAGPALAAPPSESAPVRYGNDWSSAPPTTAPTITASPNGRYAYPQPTTRTQTTVNNGNAAAPQSYGTPAYPTQPSNNPFATSQPAAPPASSTTRSLAPPPWPTNSSSSPAPPPTTSWGSSSTPVTPVDRSLLANPAPQATGDWSSIGSTIAAPPMLLPQLPTSTNSVAPLNTTSFDNGPSFTTNSYPGTQPSFGSSVNSTPQSSPPPTTRPAPTSDSWAGSWDGSATSNTASIGSNTSNSSRPVATREPEFPSSQRVATNPQDARSTPARTDSWTDDWSRNSQSPSGPSASIGGSKTTTIGSTSSPPPAIQPPVNAPPLAPPAIGSTGNNMNFNGANPNAPSQPVTVNTAKPTQGVTTNGEGQPWGLFLGTILVLAFSLAFNIYLGWSYMDARQKYQALVRRTADTFRRTKVAA